MLDEAIGACSISFGSTFPCEGESSSGNSLELDLSASNRSRLVVAFVLAALASWEVMELGSFVLFEVAEQGMVLHPSLILSDATLVPTLAV
jgi:hypothetical protein